MRNEFVASYRAIPLFRMDTASAQMIDGRRFQGYDRKICEQSLCLVAPGNSHMILGFNHFHRSIHL